ncbi:E3 SUMO-protein ligase ZBED1-like [Onychostoma macrolepis]|uniref:E3 SUMO-protein ligase ZBED1-like n=1 Tax=Onychostoma macrolepis TaxID=369639 RepID=UPI00272A3C77|nr:E3 SUMO-protein ligase ZBED1-like [Onychostoma macrolepis]
MFRAIRHRQDAPQNVQELSDALVQIWEEIPQDTIRCLIRSIHQHCVLYNSTLCVSSDKSATAGQILPILDKLKKKFKVEEDDSAFKRAIKEKVWTDLSPRYTYERNYDLQRFLEEATALDVRFKSKVQHEAVWAPLEKEAVTFASRNKGGEVTQEEKGEELLQQEEEEEQDHRFTEDRKPAAATAHTALGELFKDEDQALLVLERVKMDVRGPSVTEKAKKEIQVYRSFPTVLSSVDPILWWWQKRDQMPMLARLAKRYLCVQASFTPSERVFSTAGDTVSVERARLLPERVDMLIFLKKNC